MFQDVYNETIVKSKYLDKSDLKSVFFDSDRLKMSVSDLFISKIVTAYPDVNLTWFITGEGEMLLSPQSVDRIEGSGVKSNSMELCTKCEAFEKEVAYLRELQQKKKLINLLRGSVGEGKKQMSFLRIVYRGERI